MPAPAETAVAHATRTTPLAGPARRPRVVVAGATGFVGQALCRALEHDGVRVRGLTRDAGRAQRRWPQREWLQVDLAGSASLATSLRGCSAAFFLVHSMGDARGTDFRRREVAQAERFAAAAAQAGVGRIVYLGGVAPSGEPSEHLRSRLEVGQALRAGPSPALELRASMIVGAGSLSWLMVRDLAARLPAMVLPRWLCSRTQPVAIDDVVAALVAALHVPLPGGASAVYDLPGPDCLTGREILERTAGVMGLRRPLVVEAPFVTPRLSAHWVRLVTRADWSVARELVLGLESDLLASEPPFWERIAPRPLLSFDESARRALDAEATAMPVTGAGRAVERIVARLCRAA
jgi:uncharacterized protein YbjT (DUF2867 family)